jgi:hypothetical protein
MKSTMRWQVLEKFIKQHNLKIGAEIGVWQARTSSYLLQNCDIFLYCIDIWEETPGYDKPKWNHRSNERHSRHLLKPFADKCKIIKDYSHKASQQIQDNELDFVFIDGDHTTSGVVQDIESFWQKVKPNHYIMGHDYDRQGVKDGVHKFCKEPNQLPNGIWWFKRWE